MIVSSRTCMLAEARSTASLSEGAPETRCRAMLAVAESGNVMYWTVAEVSRENASAFRS